MIADIPNWVLVQWQGWYELHNLVGPSLDPHYRGDILLARAFAMMMNHWRKDKPLQPEDILPYKLPKPPQSPELHLQAGTVPADILADEIYRYLQSLGYLGATR